MVPCNYSCPASGTPSTEPVLSEEGKLKNLILGRSHLYGRKKMKREKKINHHGIKLGVIAKISKSNI